MKRLLSRVTALSLAACMLLSLSSCGEKKPDYPTKAELTADTLTYSQEELEALKSGEHYVADADVPALYKYFEGRVKIGVAFTTRQIHEIVDPTELSIRDGIIKHYNMYTLGNEFKPDHMNPSEGVYNFTDADEFVEFAEAAGADAVTPLYGTLRCRSGGSRQTLPTQGLLKSAGKQVLYAQARFCRKESQSI